MLCVVALFADRERGPRSATSPPTTSSVILAQTVIVAIGAIGMTLVIVSGGIDLSVGSVIALAGVVARSALRERMAAPPRRARRRRRRRPRRPRSTALAITRLRVVPFIATLGHAGDRARGGEVAGGERRWSTPPRRWVNELAVTVPSAPWMLFAPGVWITLVLAIVMAFVLRRTVFGRRVFALGSNEAAARACGIAIGRLKIAIYSVAGLFFGLAGVMQMSRLRQGDPTVAIGIELDVIAAVVIGGGSLNGGEGSILGSMVGALMMAFLRNGCQQMGWPTYVQEIIIGVIIVAAVAVDRWRHAQGGDE